MSEEGEAQEEKGREKRQEGEGRRGRGGGRRMLRHFRNQHQHDVLLPPEMRVRKLVRSGEQSTQCMSTKSDQTNELGISLNNRP